MSQNKFAPLDYVSIMVVQMMKDHVLKEFGNTRELRTQTVKISNISELFSGNCLFICAQYIMHYSHLILFMESDNYYRSTCLRLVVKWHMLLPSMML